MANGHTPSLSPSRSPKDAEHPGLSFRAVLIEGGAERVEFART